MRRLAVAVSCAALVAFAMPGSAGADEGRWPVCGEWRNVPLHGETFVHTRDVAVVSPTDAWITGSMGELFWQSSVYRWTGLRWSQVPFPVPDTGAAPADDWWIGHFAVVAPNEVWAVGGYSYYKSESRWIARPLIARWDGSRWSLVRVGIPRLSGTLYGVASIPGTDDLWAVGVRYPHGDREQPFTLALRWDGVAWHRVATPNLSDHGNALRDVAVAGGTAFAVGLSQRPDSEQTLILRWTGARWVTSPGPSPGSEASLVSVAIGTTDRAYAVGTANLAATTERSRYRGFVVRWDGASWRVARLLDRPSSLEDVVAASPSDVWAVGSRGNRPLVLRRVGTVWHASQAPDVRGSFTTIDGTPNNLWAGHTWVKIDSARSDTYHRC